MILTFILTWALPTLVFIGILAILVLIHEWGHFMAARSCGMEVEEFGFGFPPRVYGKKIKGTLYSFNLIPLGGFVRIKGEDGKDKGPGTFGSKSVAARIFVVCAGVLMNFVLAFVAIMVAFYLHMPPLVSHPDAYHGVVTQGSGGLYVNQIQDGSLAYRSDVQVGDVIIKIADTVSPSTADIRQTISNSHGKFVALTVYREGAEKIVALKVDNENILGVGLNEKIPQVSYQWYAVPYYALLETGKVIGYTFMAIVGFLKNLVFHQVVPADVTGPIGIFELTAVAVKLGFGYVLTLLIILSVNLGIINILPFPALDGGRFVFLLVEKIRGRSVAAQVETVIHNIGFIILLILIVLVTYRDIVRL
ncbi:MAG: M50 family metallopeptidase [Patescibacteria group bacterium]